MKQVNRNLVIRRNREKDLSLEMNSEEVFFLFSQGQMIDNGLNYDILSDKYNIIEKGE